MRFALRPATVFKRLPKSKSAKMILPFLKGGQYPGMGGQYDPEWGGQYDPEFAQIALAWILCQNDSITAIPGTRKIHRLEENIGAYSVVLNKADLEFIEASIPKITIGSRY